MANKKKNKDIVTEYSIQRLNNRATPPFYGLYKTDWSSSLPSLTGASNSKRTWVDLGEFDSIEDTEEALKEYIKSLRKKTKFYNTKGDKLEKDSHAGYDA